MKLILSVLFYFFLLGAEAQVEDHFDDGNFTSSPVWTGDDADYNVNATGQLQLNATIAGNSGLSVAAAMTTLDSCEWRIYIKLGFPPSTSNNARVYLSSDQADLKGPLNGYFLQFGEALSADAIELYRQNGTALTLVCRGQNGLIANSFEVAVKVTRISGKWSLYTDYTGGNTYAEEATGIDSVINVADKVGVLCKYTSGNVDNFFFDDVYAGRIIPDTIPPRVVSVDAETSSSLKIIFSEIVTEASALDVLNYNIDGMGNPVSITNDIDPLIYHLQFGNAFLPGHNYTITVSGISDLHNLPMPNEILGFTFYPLTDAGKNDIIFTEVYFQNSSTSPLPDAEYVEIYNRRDSSVLVSGWRISDGNSDGLIPGFRLGPRDYVVLYPEEDSAGFNFPDAVGVTSFPSLNNDGDHLVLTNSEGDTISEISFDNGSYRNENKDGGGWSLERIDLEFLCDDDLNWKASEAIGHGTPGEVNSIIGNYNDDVSPFAKNVFVSGINSVEVEFSEEIHEGTNDVWNFEIKKPDGGMIYPASIFVQNNETIELILPENIVRGIYTINLTNQIKDCPGNSARPEQKTRFGISEKANVNDILINEILFDPYDDGTDYLELINASQRIIDLKGWIVEEADYEDSTLVRDNSILSENHNLIFPGDYLVLSRDEKKIMNNYSCDDPEAFLNVESLPDFNSDEGRAIIYNEEGLVISDLKYSESMHFQLLALTKGVSLERLSDNTGIETKFNWHSAAATAGFGTPGYRNSQQIVLDWVDDEVTIGSEIFSPDNDGYQDVLTINYKFQQTGNVLSLNVYDFNGLPVRTLLAGDLVGMEGTLNWNGLRDDNMVAASGIYIILASRFDLDGNTRVTKRVCYLTRKM